MIDRDPILATPLAERGLLQNFEPSRILEHDSAERLAETLTEVVMQYPPASRQLSMVTITSTHWGSGKADRGTIAALERSLSEHGLITPAAQDGLFAMESSVRLLILTLFAQALRTQLASQGINLHLATDSASAATDMACELELYMQNDSRRTGNPYGALDAINPLRLARDLHDVGADLSAVPLDEVLDFRAENGRTIELTQKVCGTFWRLWRTRVSLKGGKYSKNGRWKFGIRRLIYEACRIRLSAASWQRFCYPSLARLGQFIRGTRSER